MGGKLILGKFACNYFFEIETELSGTTSDLRPIQQIRFAVSFPGPRLERVASTFGVKVSRVLVREGRDALSLFRDRNSDHITEAPSQQQ